MGETPTITSSAYTSASVFAADAAIEQLLGGQAVNQARGMGLGLQAAAAQFKPKEIPVSAARIVKVFIADPNDNLPLDKRVLYSGDEKLTDMTDQELFYEVPIAEIMAKHNEVRKGNGGQEAGREVRSRHLPGAGAHPRPEDGRGHRRAVLRLPWRISGVP
jgi:hypothetical protein